MEDRSYEIMSGDTVAAVWQCGELEVRDYTLLPLYLKRVKNADMWLETRAIDSHRANSRLLKKALRLTERDDISTVIHVSGATITDNYWVRPIGLEKSYADVRYGDDYFASLALKGDYDSFERAARSGRSKTPELTNIGSFEKCWRLHDGSWWMYKRASYNELFSELFVCRLGRRLGMNMAEYIGGDGCVKSLDFTNSAAVNFEPAASFMGDNEDYADVVSKLCEICPQALGDYVRMIFLDTITANPDRHTNNFGLLRDIKTGEMLGLAPNYDNNMALISRGYPNKPSRSDYMISLFNEFIESQPDFRRYIPVLCEADVRSAVAEVDMQVDTERIVELVMSRYKLIKK